MPKPLSLFIRPPYNAWTTNLNYGDDLPATLSYWGATSEFLLLETTTSDVPIYAASSGYLSTRSPFDPVDEVQEELVLPPDFVVPDQFNIYLIPDPNPDPNYHAKANGLPQDEPLLYPGDQNPLQFFSNPIGAFYYINLDTASLKDAIFPHLHLVGIPGSTPAIALFEYRWLHFLAGQLDVPVTVGMSLGSAARPILPGADDTRRHIGFTVFSRNGTHDPAHFYDFMREFVNDETDIDAFLNKAPKRWPLIDTGITKQEAIDKTAEKLYPYPVLEAVRKNFLSNWSAADWRKIGDNQKALYRRRLLVRVGEATPDIDDPPFKFNNPDWKNIFQLEAIVEFYMNYDDPWDPTSEPQDPQPEDRVDFLPLEGKAAQLTWNSDSTIIDLDGQPDMSKIWVGRDIIVLTGSGQTEAHRIIDADLEARKVTVSAQVNTGNDASWKIKHRPILVIIDSFGGRLRGKAAAVSTSDPSDPGRPTGPRVLKLAGVSKSQIKRIRKNFTTIYLNGDTANNGVEPRTYRIEDVDIDRRLVTVDKEPKISDTGTPWMIPAGLGGQIPKSDSLLTKRDDYDAVLFVISNGVVESRYRWSSFTSRKHTDSQGQSSVRGNRKYFINSIKSKGAGKKFRNFSMMVTDRQSYIWGSGAKKESSKTFLLPDDPDLSLFDNVRPHFLFLYGIANGNNTIGGYWINQVDKNNHTVKLYANPSLAVDEDSSWRLQLYDGVHEARRYFLNPVTADEADADEIPNVEGKRLIRLHYGGSSGNYSGSKGCIVSPYYYEMRNSLIEIYQDEHELLNGSGTEDEDIDEVFQNETHNENKDAYDDIDDNKWNNKIVGTLWLIRPDERPLG